jgi:hypothetical protein
MRTVAAQKGIKEVDMCEASALCRDQLFSTLEHLKERILEVESWLKQWREVGVRPVILQFVLDRFPAAEYNFDHDGKTEEPKSKADGTIEN